MVAGLLSDVLHQMDCSYEKAYDIPVVVCNHWLKKYRYEKIIPSWRILAAKISSLIGQYQLSHDLLKVYIIGKIIKLPHIHFYWGCIFVVCGWLGNLPVFYY